MTSPFTEDFLGFAKSLNGGANWTVTESAYNMHGIRGILFPTAVRVNGFPRIGVDKSGGARNGWIYIFNYHDYFREWRRYKINEFT